MALGHADVAGGFALGAGGGERDVFAARVEDFEFVDAGLQDVRGLDGEAQALSLHRRKAVRVFAGVDHGALGTGFCHGRKLGELFVDFCEACFELFFLGTCCLGCGCVQIAVGILDTGDEGLHGVVILGGDGIELVIVATGAADAEAEEGLAEVHDHLINGVLACEALGGIVLADLAGQQHGGGDEESGGGVLAHGISYYLFLDEAIVGRVVVEGADDVVAVGPGIGALGVDLKAVRICVAHDIEPVLRPAFAVAFAFEQAVD